MQQTANKVPPRNSASDGKRARKSEAVFQDLRRKVLTGELTSESPITEQSLAQDYGCSQSTIREALMLLQEYGLVVRLGYQGTFVTNPSQLEARLMLRLRIDIETTGIAEAVGNVTPEDLAELRELDRQFERCHANRDVFGCAEIDLSFHLKLFPDRPDAGSGTHAGSNHHHGAKGHAADTPVGIRLEGPFRDPPPRDHRGVGSQERSADPGCAESAHPFQCRAAGTAFLRHGSRRSEWRI
ncbi:GntR family transcriptional regulator [Roseibium salinum]|nr:GntR family transcriptional regulator [Roseibium salinum]